MDRSFSFLNLSDIFPVECTVKNSPSHLKESLIKRDLQNRRPYAEIPQFKGRRHLMNRMVQRQRKFAAGLLRRPNAIGEAIAQLTGL